uniref:uncharacterized protein LOC122758279 n=1 Tax=Solea senegalensis TaxID=28829 RepID=UPI001CD820B5|nr:uncharacterized protein LOC122758279 [Solea senegalensis]
MSPVYLSLFYVSVLMTVHPWEAESEGSDCFPDIRVRRHTAYEILVGQDLVINCTVVFCSSPPPAVSWLKTHVPVDVSSQSHIKTEWKLFKELEGMSYLIFQKIRSNDSGLYQCRSASDLGHAINVSVRGDIKSTLESGDIKSTTVKPQLNYSLSTLESALWPCVYRAAATMVFFGIVAAICVTSKLQRTGVCCVGQSRNKPDLSLQPSHDPRPTGHVYENDMFQNRSA